MQEDEAAGVVIVLIRLIETGRVSVFVAQQFMGKARRPNPLSPLKGSNGLYLGRVLICGRMVESPEDNRILTPAERDAVGKTSHVRQVTSGDGR